jgi:hypothetical protein
MKYIALFLLFFTVTTGYAQDQLFKKDNSKTDVKILEITPTEIKYKLFTYQDGPTITILKSEVALIIYQNGAHEAFNTAPVQQTQPVIVYAEDVRRLKAKQRQNTDSLKLIKFRELTATKNLVSLNMLEPLNGSIGVSYLREFADGLFHVYVPVSVGVAEPIFNQARNTLFGNTYYDNSYISDYKYKRKTIEAGLGFHVQTSGKRAVTHFVGPYVGISQFIGSYNSYIYDPNNYYGYQQQVNTSHDFVMNRYTIMLDNGILIRIHKNFNMMLLAGFGYHWDDYLSNNPRNFAQYNSNYFPSAFSDFPINSIKLGLSLGYRF